MNKVQVLALFSCIPIVISLKPFDDLRARYDTYKTKDSFFKLPQTTKSPEIKDYVKVEEYWHLPIHVYCYPNDPRLCLMYDFNGYVVGVQISILFKDVKLASAKYQYATLGGFVYSDIFNIPAWAFRAYFTNPEKLTTAGRKNVHEVVEGVWVYLNGTLKQVPRREGHIGDIGPFPEQSCVPGAGNIYMYNLSPELSCEKIFPFYVYYYEKSLIGVGIGGFGKASFYKKIWYTDLNVFQLKTIFPNHPKCFPTWTLEYGFPTLTIFLVDRPWEHKCPQTVSLPGSR